MSLSKTWKTIGLLALLAGVYVASMFGQEPTSVDPQQASAVTARVSQTQCKQWDDAMLALFNIALVASIAVPLLISPFLGALGRMSWFFASPFKRIVVVSVVICAVLIVTVPVGAWTVGLGWGWLSNVDPLYFACTTKAFGAEGLLFGLISPGQAALSQWPAMTLLLLVGTVLGCLLALTLQIFLARLLGMRRRLQGADE